MADAWPCAIGLDVGGTKIAAGLVALPSGEVLERQVIPTRPERGGDAVLEDCLALGEALLGQAAGKRAPVIGIGLGVPELVDPTGAITSAHNFDWRDVPVAQRFSALAPTVVESDVRAAGLAEALFGAGRAFRIFAYVTAGTGISHCLVEEGRPFTGARGNALVLASGALTSTCPICDTTSDQVLEELASGPAIVRRYNQRSARRVARAEDVLGAARTGDEVAVTVVRSAGEALGNVVGFLINVVDPEAVVVGGGLGQAGGLYWSSFVESARRHIWADNGRDLPILPAALGTGAGVVGAAATVWKRREAAPQMGARAI